MSEEVILCGQEGGFLHLICMNLFKSLTQITFKDSGDINEMSKTGEEGIFAAACEKGLWIA